MGKIRLTCVDNGFLSILYFSPKQGFVLNLQTVNGRVYCNTSKQRKSDRKLIREFIADFGPEETCKWITEYRERNKLIAKAVEL